MKNIPPCHECKVQWLIGHTKASRKILCEHCYNPEKGYQNFDKIPGLPNEVEESIKQLNKKKERKSTIPPCLIVKRRNAKPELHTRLV